jgi:hypothetical protein
MMIKRIIIIVKINYFLGRNFLYELISRKGAFSQYAGVYAYLVGRFQPEAKAVKQEVHLNQIY